MRIEELKEEVKKYFETYEDYIVDYYNYNDYIDEIIMSIADNNVYIYTSDLMNWLPGNYSYVEDYVKEFGIDSNNFDFLSIVRGGQYLQIENDLYKNKSLMVEFLMYYIMEQKGIEEISDDQYNELQTNDFDNIETITEIEEIINEVLEDEDEEEE